MRICPYPFFEATPPGAAPGSPVKTGARVRRFRGCNQHRGALRGIPGSACPQSEPNATELPSCAPIPASRELRKDGGGGGWWRGEEGARSFDILTCQRHSTRLQIFDNLDNQFTIRKRKKEICKVFLFYLIFLMFSQTNVAHSLARRLFS